MSAAEFMQQNLNTIQQKGLIPLDAPMDEITRYGYLAHHEGIQGVNDLLTGQLSNDRANHLLNNNRGTKQTVCPYSADDYRRWLINYTNENVNPNQFRNL